MKDCWMGGGLKAKNKQQKKKKLNVLTIVTYNAKWPPQGHNEII